MPSVQVEVHKTLNGFVKKSIAWKKDDVCELFLGQNVAWNFVVVLRIFGQQFFYNMVVNMESAL